MWVIIILILIASFSMISPMVEYIKVAFLVTCFVLITIAYYYPESRPHMSELFYNQIKNLKYYTYNFAVFCWHLAPIWNKAYKQTNETLKQNNGNDNVNHNKINDNRNESNENYYNNNNDTIIYPPYGHQHQTFNSFNPLRDYRFNNSNNFPRNEFYNRNNNHKEPFASNNAFTHTNSNTNGLILYNPNHLINDHHYNKHSSDHHRYNGHYYH